MLSYLEVLKEQENCCLPAFLVQCCLLAGGGVLGEGLAEQLHAWSRWIAAQLAQRAAVQGLGGTERATRGPSLCVTGLRRVEPLLPLRGPSLWAWKLHTGELTPGGFVQAVLAETHWMNK